MGCVESAIELDIPHEKYGLGTCTKCNREKRYLYNITYNQGPNRTVNIVQQCYSCIFCISCKPNFWFFMEKNKINSGIGCLKKYQLEGDYKEKKSENLLQCQQCTKYDHTIYDLHLHHDINYYKLPPRSKLLQVVQ